MIGSNELRVYGYSDHAEKQWQIAMSNALKALEDK